MQQNQNNQLPISEPPISDDDTNPSGIRPIGGSRPPISPLSRALGFALSAGAVLLTAAAAVLYFQQSSTPAPTPPPPTVIIATRAPTAIPTQAPPTSAPQDLNQPPAPDVLAELMAQPIDTTASNNVLYRQQTAFTIAPPGPRSAPIDYKIQVGDTIEKIAAKFNITQDTIVWNNDVGYINRLEVGTPLTILPIDGILYTPSSDETIQQIADKFKVSAYSIIDSEYNKLQSATPSLLLPANSLRIMIPGGVSKKVAIYWKPTINTLPAAAGAKGGGQISFGGGAGSCGYQSNGGGDGSLGYPVQNYTFIRGFTSYHSGVDLAKPTGSPVVAAGAGTVIFAGWSDWGYGYAIVIAHTPKLMTLYGHLSQIAVSCGQVVARAAYIGAVGSTGNSSGPHLHFEIRENQVPVDPVSVMGGF